MAIKYKAITLIGLFLVSGFLCSGQNADSLQAETIKVLRKMDSIRKADSISTLELHQHIEQLQNAPTNKQREVLLQKVMESRKADSIRNLRQIEQLRVLKKSAVGAPVAPFGDTLFFIYTNLGGFRAADRAKAINSRVQMLYENTAFHPDSLSVNIYESSAEIAYRDVTIMSVNGLEALWFDRKPGDLANDYRVKIKTAISLQREENSFTSILIRISAILAILLGIYLVIRLINKLFRKLNRRTIYLKDKALKGIRFRGYQFLDSDRELRVLLFAINILRLFIIILVLYIALPLMFSVFPWTQGIAYTLIGWVTTPLKRVFGGLVDYLPNLFTILVIVGVTHYVSKFLQFVAGEIERGALVIPGFFPDWSKPTLNIVKFLLFAFSFIIIFPYLPGSDSPIFQGVSVFVGILFSLGSSSAISNAVAGLVITYMRPFKVGDRIKIGELSGDVIEKSLLVTRIRTIKNENITIPNSTILSSHTVNYSTSADEHGLILHTTVTIGYDVPWKQVHELLIAAAVATHDILTEKNLKPYVLQTSLDDFYVSYQLNAYTHSPKRMAAIYSELHQNIQDQFNQAGVEIMSPHYRAARDGNTMAIPQVNLPPGYKPSAFNITLDNKPEKA